MAHLSQHSAADGATKNDANNDSVVGPSSAILVFRDRNHLLFDKIFPVDNLVIMDVEQTFITLPVWSFWASRLASISVYNTTTDAPRMPFPSLQTFCAVSAPKFEATVCPANMPNLRTLKIHKSAEKQISIAGFPLLHDIVINCCVSSALRFDLPQLHYLHITGCSSLTHLVIVGSVIAFLSVSHITQLTHLQAENCAALELLEFPPSLEELHVSDCPALRELNHYETFRPNNLRTLKISNCPLLTLHLLRRG